MIGIVDYGLGNIGAFARVYANLRITTSIAKNPDDLRKADKIILPGVGSFDYAMQKLDDSGMRETLDELVLHNRTPVLGVCVGMQMFAESSEEGKLPGLGWLNGRVKRFDQSLYAQGANIPHMGWNDVRTMTSSYLMANLQKDARFYFLHSYYFHCTRPENTIATTDYGIEFSCVVGSDNIFGVQFHPEKSHHWGILLLKNFAEM